MRAMLVSLGLLLLAAWGLLDALGGREAARVVSGAVLTADEAMVGAAYVAMHLAAVIVAPVLLGAAALLAIVARQARTSHDTVAPPS